MIFWSFLFGSCLGSWICASATRYDQPELKQNQRSVCPHCKETLLWCDLIPIFSWIHLRGKCRFCHHSIPIDHLACEVLMGLLMMWCITQSKPIVMTILISTLVYAAYTDAYHGLIPDRCHVLVLLAYLLSGPGDFILQGLYTVTVFLVLYLLAKFGKGLGFGDVKLIASMSLWFSAYELIWMICIASTSALLVTCFSKIKKDKIRFAPYLSFACFVVLLFSTV